MGHVRQSGVKHILVIEDSLTDANLIRLMLGGDPNHRLQVAGSLSEAARAVEANPPNLILLDLHLPDADGLEAVDAAAELAGAAPIVVLTGSDDETLALEALKRGAQDYINKNDANPKLLHRVVRHAEERQRLVRQLQTAQDRLERQSRSDPLTGLLNRRGLEQELERACRQGRRAGETMHVVAWDLDDFKAINDLHGHAVGDELLIEIATCAQRAFRATDPIARIGGDEFMALLPDTRSAEATVIAERLCSSIFETPFEAQGKEIGISVSVGVVAVDPERALIGDLLVAVDGALYRSKREGKNRVSAGEAREPAATHATDLAHRFDAEPLLDPATEEPAAYELLLRPAVAGGPPVGEILEAFRRNGGSAHGDLQLLERAVLASADLDDRYACHVNLLPSTLQSFGAPRIAEVLRLGGDRPYCIDFSEQQIVGDPSLLTDALAELRSLGYAIGLDHIGSGRSSLETLLAVEPDVVKVDVRWSAGLESSPGRRRELAKLLRILAIPESMLVVPRPEAEAGRRALLEIGRLTGVPFLWSDPARSIRLGSASGRDRSLAAAGFGEGA